MDKEFKNTLKSNALEKLCSSLPEDNNSDLFKTITELSINATIATLEEYERLKED